jgi:chromosome segregation ATPase
LSVDSLTQLENKIDGLIANMKTLKEEKTRLSEELEQKNTVIREFEAGTQSSAGEIELLKKNLEDKQKKLDSAAEKIQGLLTKLESVA